MLGLSRATAAVALCGLVLAAAAPVAAASIGSVGTDAAVREPRRLTAGDSDQLLGSLGPDRRTLFFASNRDAVVGAFAQRLPDGVARALFDEGADISLPRPSPDGKRLLYISTRDDATGDTCLRELESDKRTCIGGPATAESAAFWFPDGKSIGVVARSAMHGEQVLRRVWLGRREAGTVQTGEIVVDRSVSTPAVSPDGAWLTYVPVERASKDVGVHFAMRLGRGLHVRKLKSAKAPRQIVPALPGVTGFPAFSRDGRWLYFTQSLHDSNGDGQVDGDDHGVIFRTPFRGDQDPPIRPGEARQLTSASWNCRYPAPADETLIMTCERGGRLDLYALPLDGAVPENWAEARIRTAIDHTDDPDRISLLLTNLAQLQREPAARAATLQTLARQALRRGDPPLASWYATRAATAVEGTPSATSRRATAAALSALAEHRRAIDRVDAGGRDEGFAASAEARLAGLVAAPDAPDAAAWVALVRAEIDDDLGREEQALATLRALPRAEVLGRDGVLAVVLLGVPRLRGLLAAAEADAWLWSAATHPALSAAERLAVAAQISAALTRGRKPTAARKALDEALSRAPADGELAVRLAAARTLLDLPPADARGPTIAATAGLGSAEEEAVREKIFALFRANRELDRRRAVIRATVAAAAKVDSAYLLYQFANTWVSGVPRDHPARQQAVALFRQVVLERAWISWQAGRVGDARGSFYGVTLQDDDLEAWLGFVEARLAEGKRDALVEVEKRFAKQPEHPALCTVRAWLTVRGRAELAGPAAADRDALERADADLATAQRQMPGSRHLHHLRGWIAHQRFLLGDGREFAVIAHDRYRLALALAEGDGRIRGALLAALGLLQQSVGNHRLALEALRKRLALPFVRPQSRLAMQLAAARSHWHVGEADAALDLLAEAERAVREQPALARARGLILDRMALYGFEAGRADVAQRAAAALAQHPVAGDSVANRARRTLVLAASRLQAGDPAGSRAALTEAGRLLAGLNDDDLGAGRRPHQPRHEVNRERLLALRDGLLARALIADGAPAAALPILDRRLAGLAGAEPGSRDQLDRAAARWHRGLTLSLLGRKPEAMRELGLGLADAAAFAEASGTVAPPERIWLVRSAAEFHLFGDAPLAALGRPLLPDLRAVYAALSRFGAPRWRSARDALQLLLTLLDPATQSAPAGG